MRHKGMMATRFSKLGNWLVLILAAAGLLGRPSTAGAQTSQAPPPAQSAPPATPPAQDPPAVPTEGALPLTPAQLQKIKTAIIAPSVLTRSDERLRFYMEIVAKQPSFKDFLFESDDLRNGPVKGAPMSHQEFLNMVTPKQIYGPAGITATDLLQFGVVNWATHAAINKIKEMREARSFQEVQAIRARIDRELAALRGGGSQN